MKRHLFILSALVILSLFMVSTASAYHDNSYTYVKKVSSSPYGSTTYISKESPSYSYEYHSTKTYGHYNNRLYTYWHSGSSHWNHYSYPYYSDTYVRKTYNTGYYDYYYKPYYNSKGYYNHRY